MADSEKMDGELANESASSTPLDDSPIKTDQPMCSKHEVDECVQPAVTSPGSSRASSVARSEGGSSSTKSQERKFPIRTGIIWKANAKVEAMDFLKKWYPAKIVEVDDEEMEVLIHFEGWNARFDEWLEMTSDRLRPATRHSDRKEGRKIKKTLHKVGERVLAKWTDCRMYPAKVVGLQPTGAYDVVFYDGFKRVIQAINIKPLPDDLKTQHFDFAPSQGKAQEEVLPPRRKRSSDSRNESGERRRSRESDDNLKKEASEIPVKVKTPPIKMREASPPRKKKPTHKVDLTKSSKFRKTDRVLSAFMKKKVPAAETKKMKDDATAQLVRKKKKQLIDGVFQAKRTKVECTNNTVQELSPQKHGTTSEIQASKEQPDTAKDEPLVPSSELETDIPMPIPASDALTDHHLQCPSKLTVRLTPCVLQGETETAAALEPGGILSKLAPKEFKVEEDHNPYKCPFDNCDKSFRKESLLKYHIKYYHMEDGSLVPMPVSKKRKPTLSMCSTDSDVSVCSKSGGSSNIRPAMKKKRVTSAPSVLENIACDSVLSDQEEDTAEADMQSDSEQRSVSASVHDDFDEDSDHDDEVVNCTCGHNDENGLMIQCDVCLCWQHASCFDITVETLPKKYVCYVCRNPPGVRDSARYMYDQDYFKFGQLTRFNAAATGNDEKVCKSIQSSHLLMGDLINIQDVLGSLRRKTHMLNESDEDEFKIWQTNWDSYTGADVSCCDQPIDVSIGDQQSNNVENSETKLESVDVSGTCHDTSDHIDVCGEGTEEVMVNKQEIIEEDAMSNPVVRPSSFGVSLASLPVTNSVYKLSPVPTHVKVTGSSLWTPVARNLSQPDLVEEGLSDDINNNLEIAEQNLREHIHRLQDKLEERLDLLDQQVTELETKYAKPAGNDPLSDLPVVKKSLRTFISDLDKVRRMAAFHC